MARIALRYLAGVMCAALCTSGADPTAAEAAGGASRPYTVAVTALPERLEPWHTTVGGFYYITAQFYYPLFERLGPGGQLASRFFDMEQTFACDRSMRHFKMCLQPQIAFSNGERITADDLASSVAGIHNTQQALPSPTIALIDSQCITVTLSRPDSAYFDRLNTSASTLLKASTLHERYPVGLGDYVLESWTPDELVGVYRGDAASIDFPRFAFRRVRDLEDAVAQGIDDVNVMYWAPHKRQTLHSYRVVSHPLLRNYALVTSFVDPALGRLFARCFDVEAFRSEALQVEMLATPGFLPHGVPGWREQANYGDRSDLCDLSNGVVPVVYVSHMDLLGNTTRDFFERFNRNSRFAVDVRDGSVEGAVALANKKQENVVYLLGFGTYSSQAAFYGDPTAFYGFFVRHGTQELRSDLATLINASTTGTGHGKELLYRQMHRTLLDSGAVIGLGQHPPTLYYHPSIVGGVLADTIMGYMKISTVRKKTDA